MQKLAAPARKIRILLVDDHAVIRMGLMTAVSDAADMDVVADVESGPDAIEVKLIPPDAVSVVVIPFEGLG